MSAWTNRTPLPYSRAALRARPCQPEKLPTVKLGAALAAVGGTFGAVPVRALGLDGEDIVHRRAAIPCLRVRENMSSLGHSSQVHEALLDAAIERHGGSYIGPLVEYGMPEHVRPTSLEGLRVALLRDACMLMLIIPCSPRTETASLAGSVLRSMRQTRIAASEV